MATQAIQCPGCRAADTSSPDANGIHTCNYCGVRFHISSVTPASQTPFVVVQPARSQGLVLGSLLGGVLAISGAAGAWVYMNSHDASDEPNRPVEHDARPMRADPRPTEAPRAAGDDPSSSTVTPTIVEVDEPAAPEPAVSATAEFELHGTRKGYQNSFYVLGYVTNTSPFAIRKPKLTVVLLDGQGKEVMTKNGYAVDDAIDPGQRSAVSVLIKDPPEHASFEVEVVPRRVGRFDGRTNQAEGLEIEAGEPRKASFGSGIEISGRVKNEGAQAAKFVNVRVMGFDANDKLMGIYSTYADGEQIEAGGSARFSTMPMLFDETPARFELTVTGRPAD